ncbi:MAG: protein phosphatase 2C domain-containing protein [Thermogemmatispora sp.]|uniref:protein phosphatase 2C domain-containing protein n=1 Tax=Thermogemmatispora sp. TaxID=1968838 RepID=UPI00260EBAEF|nr:protein phosphatase 2C domain-containing protein [Thermogemmatispora sp.]MBX5455623.1 protein phosphatase 2C domain-containing protein [Thermogemmatispora sp.]
MICPVCSTPNRDDAKFCKSCGRSLPREAPAGESSAASEQSTGQSQGVERVAASQEPEDPSLAPTLILTPERMMAYHSQRWQRELEEAERQQQQANSRPEQETRDVADLPTILLAPGMGERMAETPGGAVVSEQSPASAAATGERSGQAEPGSAAASSSPPSSGELMGASAAQPVESEQPASAAVSGAAEGPAEPAAEGATEEQSQEGTTTAVEEQPSADQPAQPEAAEQTSAASAELESQSQQAENLGGEAVAGASSGPLESGTLLGGRYLINQLVQEEEHERIYQVTDQQGYQRCWNCGSQENAEGDEFCINCGAELLGMPYLLHEFSGERTSPETQVTGGHIINTFIEGGRTYAVEQPQAERDPFPEGVHLMAAALSDAGILRRDQPNEDSTLVLLLERSHESISQPMGIFIVADGMGGHASGQLASRVAVNTIAERIVRDLLAAPLSAERESQQPPAPAEEDQLVRLLQEAVEEANSRLCQINQQNKTDMGCTLTGFMIVGRHSYIVNVGDSRTYMVRGGQLYQRTTDHSLVGQLVAGGLLQPDEVYTHPQRSQIFRSLGDRPNVQIDLFKQELYPGDILLSCSDGLWEMVRDPQIESILNAAPDPQTACAQLIEAANANGGEDNISAVVVFVR